MDRAVLTGSCIFHGRTGLTGVRRTGGQEFHGESWSPRIVTCHLREDAAQQDISGHHHTRIPINLQGEVVQVAVSVLVTNIIAVLELDGYWFIGKG